MSTRGIDQESQLELIRVNVKIKFVIIIVLKSDLRVNWSKAQITGWKGQHGLTKSM